MRSSISARDAKRIHRELRARLTTRYSENSLERTDADGTESLFRLDD
jgi:hypothetical protein